MITVDITKFTRSEYPAYLERGIEKPLPEDSWLEPGLVVHNKNHNSLGVVLGMIDYSYGDVRTDADGMVSIDDLRPASFVDVVDTICSPTLLREVQKQYDKVSKISLEMEKLDTFNDDDLSELHESDWFAKK